MVKVVDAYVNTEALPDYIESLYEQCATIISIAPWHTKPFHNGAGGAAVEYQVVVYLVLYFIVADPDTAEHPPE
jgi:hypothetical protein